MHVAFDGGEQQAPALWRFAGQEFRPERLHHGAGGLGALQHLGDYQVPGGELLAHLGHGQHHRSVDYIERRNFGEQGGHGFLDPGLGAVQHGQAQFLFGRGVLRGGAGGGLLGVAVARGESLGRVRVAGEDKVFGESPLFGGDRGVALKLLDVHYGQIQPGFHGVVQEYGIQHLARGGRQAEGNVAHAQDGLYSGEFLLDGLDSLDSLVRGPGMLPAHRHREDQRVENYVFRPEPAFPGKESVGPAGYGELAHGVQRQAVRLILVDAAEDQFGAVGFHQLRGRAGFFQAEFEVDRVKQRLAGRRLQHFFHHGHVGTVGHQGQPHRAGQPRDESLYVVEFVALGVGQADVQDMRPGRRLGLGQGQRPVPIPAGHHVAEFL